MNWLSKLFGKKKDKPEPLFKEVRVGNDVALYDQQTVDYMESNQPNPTQDRLFELIKASNKIVVSKMESNEDEVVKIPFELNGKITEMEGHPIEKVQVHEITAPSEIKQVIRHFEVLDTTNGHLMSSGELIFDFVDESGQTIQVEYVGHGYIRIEGKFKDDAVLKRPMDLLNWLKSIGIPEPLDIWIESQNREELRKNRIVEWKSVAPKVLVDFMENQNRTIDSKNIYRLYSQLDAEIPDRKEQILSLFQLYGTGFRPWNGVPFYEMIPLNMLLALKTTIVTQVLEQNELSQEQLEGASRYFSSWEFARVKKDDLAVLSDEVKQKLLAYLKESGDEKKLNLFVKQMGMS